MNLVRPHTPQLHYLYKITNAVNGHIYIGQTIDPKKRWTTHKTKSRKDIPKELIEKKLKEYGIENFLFEIIATCNSQSSANLLEIQLIEQYDSWVRHNKGYNVAKGGQGNIGYKHTEESIRKMSKERQSKPWTLKVKRTKEHSKNFSASRKGKMVGKDHPLYGTTRPEHVKQAVREANTGNQYWVGRKHTEETKAKQAAIKLGKGKKRLPCKIQDCTSISLNLNSQLCPKHYRQWRKSQGL
jgi:group I intron endonuclease